MLFVALKYIRKAINAISSNALIIQKGARLKTAGVPERSKREAVMAVLHARKLGKALRSTCYAVLEWPVYVCQNSIVFFSGVLLMELISDSEGNVAPRLSDLILTPKQARAYHKDLIDQIVKMLCAGIVHGDLSQYNVLVGSQGPVIIDLPQAVNAADNHQARHMIKRDIDNLTAYFSRFAPELAQSDYAAEIWSFYQRGKLPQAQLSGNVKQQDKPVNVNSILQIIDAVIKKEAAWQRHKQTKWGNPLSQC